MSLNIRMNKWAPKLTIIFQLTIWSIIGIILLQKGVISLCEKTKVQNDTISKQEKLTRWNEGELFKKSNITENRFKIIKFQIDTQRENITIDKSKNITSNKHIGNGIFKTISTIKKRTTIRHEHDTRDLHSIQSSTIYSNNKNEVEKIKHKANIIIPLISNENPYETENSKMNDSMSSVSFEFKDFGTTNLIRLNEKNFFEHENNEMSHKNIGNNKSEVKSRRSHVNRIGTAIAILMLAIGIVMLLLGPLIVIIRTFSHRRRTREMLKLKCYNDQPPTYEEATLMDQAPRYSTLQLDTILDSSSL
ncbi:hypothetical protein APICC_07186 [Apis cerana cerana]|uniref:Uncharacterized protein n=1 Tax=Apis cerana cerana TaxID=94128 RepID=A0A2A3E3A4_APICC|nr:hypothetical protein APICC_07186 [Apis cerana cerana]